MPEVNLLPKGWRCSSNELHDRMMDPVTVRATQLTCTYDARKDCLG